MRLTRRNGHDRVLRHGREAGPCAEVSVVQIEAEELAGETDPDDAEQSCGERSVSHPGESPYAPHGGENAKRAQALLKEIEEKPEQETAPANAKP
jgi:hypothetical protein